MVARGAVSCNHGNGCRKGILSMLEDFGELVVLRNLVTCLENKFLDWRVRL
jgi:hypothetical protein